MMTSSNGNIFRVTGPLCGEFTGPGEFPTQRPVTRSFDVYFDLRLNKRLSKQSWGWWFETLSRSLWRHRNVIFKKWQWCFHASRGNLGGNYWFFSDGVIWTAGRNSHGELGHHGTSPYPVFFPVEGLPPIVQMVVGWYSIVAISRNGTVYHAIVVLLRW